MACKGQSQDSNPDLDPKVHCCPTAVCGPSLPPRVGLSPRMESRWQAVVTGSPPVESGGSQGHWAQRLCEVETASLLYRLDS